MKKMPKCICRGKSASNHEWIYGLPVDGNGLIGLDHSRTWRQVEPQTIGEYAHMMDIKNVPIYEGDIIRANWLGAGYGIFRVEFQEETTGFVAVFLRAEEIVGVDTPKMWDVRLAEFNGCAEVIGNIHDNPELSESKPKSVSNREYLNALPDKLYSLILCSPSSIGKVVFDLHCDCAHDKANCDKACDCTICTEEWLRSPLDYRLVNHINTVAHLRAKVKEDDDFDPNDKERFDQNMAKYLEG
jgi:hypothetical protein